jgi:hypothetical protein
VKRLAIILALVLASTTAGATMLLLGAGGGSGGGGGGGGPTLIAECNGASTNTNISYGATDGDGYSEGTISGTNDTRMPTSGKPTLTTNTTYTFTFEFKDASATPASTVGSARIRLTDGTNRFGVCVSLTDGSVVGSNNGGGGSYSATSVTDLGGGKRRLTVTGTSTAWGATSEFSTIAHSDASCASTATSGTYVINRSSCKIETP